MSMTGRGRATARLESDIQVARDESNWKKVIELAEQLKTRSPNLELLALFLIGEGKLETFLLENPPLESNIQKARSGLHEARKYLVQASSKEAGEAGVSLDAFLLLGKLSFACGNYEDTLENFQKADLLNLAEKPLPCRSIRIVAESYAIKAYCLEKKLTNMRNEDDADDEAQKSLRELTTKCFETATDLTLLYLQDLEDKNANSMQNSNTGTLTTGGSPQPPSPGKVGGVDSWRGTGLIMQQLLSRTLTNTISLDPEQHLKQVRRLRSLLSAVETSATQGIRLFMARQLAELLLRGHASGPHYKILEFPTKRRTEGAWKPKRYAHNSHPNAFIPSNEQEEIILLLLISEAMAVRNAVLSQSPEFKEQRLRAFEVACNVYDQLAVCLTRWGQLRLFHECIERGAIKFSFDESHTWLQYALSLVAIGEHVHALRVLEEVHRLLPHSPVPCMLAAKTCYLHLKDHEEGIKWSKRAIATKEGQPYCLHSARAHLLLGIGLYLRSTNSTQHLTRSKLTVRAIDAMQKAQQMGPGDHLIHHHLAVVLAHNRKLPEAVASIKQALNLRPDYVQSLHLLGLLLTAQKQYQEALNLVVSALDEWPDCLDLMLLQANLEQLLSGPEAAKAVAITMLAKWKVLYEDQTLSSDHTNQSERRSESRSIFHLSESGSNPTQMSRGMPNGMSESSLSSLPRRKSSGLPWDWLVRIWLLLAELCLHANQRDQALKCIDEAQLIQPLTPDVLVARGMACEADGSFTEAKNFYESAISLEPNHLRSLQHLGKVYHCLGKHAMAEFMLRKAAKLHPAEHETWYTLGLALEAQGDHNGSADCMAVALDVENSSPLLPFSSVPLALE